MTVSASAHADTLRAVPRRIFNAFRLTVAGLLVVAGAELGLGGEHRELFSIAAWVYAVFAFVTGFPIAVRLLGGVAMLFRLQFVVDIAVLTVIMAVSGGQASGVAVLMMVYLAAAGVLAEGRMPVFFAALATLSVLGENAWRQLGATSAYDWARIGVVCVAFFAIAITARWLALRARTQETLAEERGEALDRQQAINERIIEDMPDGVLVFDAEGCVRQLNPTAEALFGERAHPGAHLPELAALVVAARYGQGGSDAQQMQLEPSGKFVRCRAVRADPAEGAAGDVVVYLTDLDEVQKQIQQQKLAALGRLTASMAHEIRNPLTAVTQAADLIGEEKRAEVQQRLVRIIQDNSRRIERMVRDVLALGRRDEVVREALPLAPALAGVVDELTLAGAAERAIYAIDVAEGVTLCIDRAHFHQIIVNLLGNARRYCSGQGGAIRIDALRRAGGRVELHVRDDGPGIEASRRNGVFEPFYTTDPKGTGLGLYIARELAEANGAALELAPDDPGAHFVLSGRSRP
ncbi:MAG: PAS domain-containing protein [Pseudazoarcus pumilus]|nr:PAS domain-containing protein [Pseudazoarcus pumilus]